MILHQVLFLHGDSQVEPESIRKCNGETSILHLFLILHSFFDFAQHYLSPKEPTIFDFTQLFFDFTLNNLSIEDNSDLNSSTYRQVSQGITHAYSWV